MRRFEYTEGKSNKFWEIEVSGSSYTTRHGRIGTDGREATKNWGTADWAAKQAEKAIASKLKKGYSEVSADAALPEVEQDDSPMGTLERTLAAAPGDYDNWLVYADMLGSAGDPRGEYVTLGVALAKALEAKDEAEVERLRLREWDMLRANSKAWFGKFVEDDDWRECFGWAPAMGFWHNIRLWVDWDHKHVDMAKALGHALSLDSAKFLRRIELGLPSSEGSADYSACIKELAKRGPFPSLRSLTIGDFTRDESEISWVHVSNVGRLWRTLTGLERLHLRGGGIALGNPKSDTLRRLELETGGLPGAAAESLARAQLPKLEYLEVWFGREEYGASCNARHVREILANQSWAGLRHLGLQNSEFSDEIVDEVVRAKLPATLRVLDLSMGTMTDKGAKKLIANKETLAKLERINLDENGLSKSMCERLAKALPRASTKRQKQGEDANYTSVGE